MTPRYRECSAGGLWVEHDVPRAFYSPQWSCSCRTGGDARSPYVWYLIHRMFWAAYLSVWIILSGTLPSYWYSNEANKVKWFVYLTNWSFLILTASAVVRAAAAVYAFVAYVRNGDHVERMTWWLKASWITYSTSAAVAIVVSILYWGIIFTGHIDIIDVNTHGINSLYLLVDLLVTATPIRVLHFWMPLAFGVAYVVFTVAYDMAGATNALDKPYIYSVLDWSSAPTTASIYGVTALVAIVLVHCLLFGLAKLRTFAAARCTSPTGPMHVAYSSELLVVSTSGRMPV